MPAFVQALHFTLMGARHEDDDGFAKVLMGRGRVLFEALLDEYDLVSLTPDPDSVTELIDDQMQYKQLQKSAYWYTSIPSG